MKDLVSIKYHPLVIKTIRNGNSMEIQKSQFQISIQPKIVITTEKIRGRDRE